MKTDFNGQSQLLINPKLAPLSGQLLQITRKNTRPELSNQMQSKLNDMLQCTGSTRYMKHPCTMLSQVKGCTKKIKGKNTVQ